MEAHKSSGSDAADMSFDNESVQNNHEFGVGKGLKNESLSGSGGSGDDSNRSFANNDEEDDLEQQVPQPRAVQDFQRQEGAASRPQSRGIRGGRPESSQVLDSQPLEGR